MSTVLPVCNGWSRGARCTETNLCKAHIVPQGFARAARKGKDLLSITIDGIQMRGTNNGAYDPSILCRSCDHVLGDFDKYAVEFCTSLPARVVSRGPYWEVVGSDGDMFAKFALAVIWRASISKRPEVSEISLGAKYGSLARDILYGNRPLSSMPAFEMLLTRLHATGADMMGFLTLPQLMSGRDYRCYGFIVGGLHVLAKVDNRRFPARWLDLIVDGGSTIRGLDHRFEQTSQYHMMAAQIRKRHRAGR